MPSLDSCIASIFEPGNIATDSGAITVPKFGDISATAMQALLIGQVATAMTLPPTPITATATQSLAMRQTATVMLAGAPRAAMVIGVFVDSSGTSRQGNVDGIMVNL